MTACDASSERAGVPVQDGTRQRGPLRLGMGGLHGGPLRPGAAGFLGHLIRPGVTGLLGSLLLLGPAGCASRARVVPVPIQKPPAEDLRLEPRDGGETSTRTAPLPGAERIYPSQDPRNQAPPGAQEAFPDASEAPSGETPPAQPEIPSPEATRPPVDAPPSSGPPPPSSESRPSGGAAPPPVSAPTGDSAPTRADRTFSVQLFATNSRAAADRRAADLVRYFDPPPRVVADGGLFKVRLGTFAEREVAESERRRAFDLGFRDAFVVESDASSPGGAR